MTAKNENSVTPNRETERPLGDTNLPEGSMHNKNKPTGIGSRLRAGLHFHFFRDSFTNRFGCAIEQTCRCGERRHAMPPFGALFRNWKPGPHPIAEAQRPLRR